MMQDGYRRITRNKIGRALKAAGGLAAYEGDKGNSVRSDEELCRHCRVWPDQL